MVFKDHEALYNRSVSNDSRFLIKRRLRFRRKCRSFRKDWCECGFLKCTSYKRYMDRMNHTEAFNDVGFFLNPNDCLCTLALSTIA